MKTDQARPSELSTTVSHHELPAETVTLAKELLGMTLVRITPQGRVSGRIVETEAYPPGDPSSHAFRGVTPRCRSMFLRHYHAYVYKIYGRSLCLNISSDAVGAGAAVLIRALSPIDGVALMEGRRRTSRLRDLTRGPGRLTQALAIGAELDGVDLTCSDELFIERGTPPHAIAVSTRIGLTKAADWPMRFFIPGDRFVSGPRALNTVTAA